MPTIPDVSAVFAPPSPGAWELETTHNHRPVSRWMAATFPAAATAGFRAGSQYYGLLLDALEFTVINGFIYMAARGVGAPKTAKTPPPKFIFKLLTRVHPEMRRRVKRSAEVFEKKLWREELAQWDRELLPRIVEENTVMQKIDARALSTSELAAHLQRCHDLVSRAIFTHHRYSALSMVALGDFLMIVSNWTSLKPSQLLPLLRGASAVSLGGTAELRSVVDEIQRRDELKMLLANSDPRAALDALAAQGGAIAESLRAYVEKVGVRVTSGYDVADVSMEELPQLLLDTIRAAVNGSGAAQDTLAADTARVRALVPAEQREAFDAALSEARATYRVRDERGYLNDAWSIGIARRALLVAGERLAASGRIHDASHVFDFTPQELTAVLSGGAAPSADEVAAYAHYRTTKTTADAPPIVGFTPSGPPPADWLPAPAARMARIIEIVMAEMFARKEGNEKGKSVAGFGASPGEITGVARLILTPADMERVCDGDILITRATGPSYNALLPLIRGIVTDRGGTLSHAALIAREYGIPAVVGCGNATELIPNGARIRVDGSSGTVHIVS